MPVEERTEERLAKEAQVLLGGGTASTARTIGFASFYILSRPELRSKLEAELKGPMANWPEQVPTWAELEQLPLLQGIIKESLRYEHEQANEETILTTCAYIDSAMASCIACQECFPTRLFSTRTL